MSHSKTYWNHYIANGKRGWFVVFKKTTEEIGKIYAIILKGCFDGCVLNLLRFPRDVSMYLLLFDPSSPEKNVINGFEE